MKAIGVLPSVVLLIGLFCILFVIVESGRKSKPKSKGRKRRQAVGVLDPETGIVRVGDKLLTPAQAKKQHVQIAGFYEAPKKTRKKSLLRPY